MHAHSSMISSMLLGLMCLSGCGSDEAPPRPAATSLPPVPLVSASELSELIENSEKPVLVEFSVMTGCFRCDDMRPQMQQLAREVEDGTHVVRLDFHANQTLAVSLGATICPSYVLFSKGQPIWTRNYPTSGGLLSSRLPKTQEPRADADSKSPSFDQFQEGASSF